MAYFNLFQIISVLLTRLFTALLYGHQYSIIESLDRLEDRVYLMTFQVTDKKTLNPRPFEGFMGCMPVPSVTAWFSYKTDLNIFFYFILSGAIVYFISVFGMPVFSNVPLNRILEDINIKTASVQEIIVDRNFF